MYFWNIEGLKRTLSSTGLSEKENYYYLLILALVGTGGLEFMAYFPYENPNIWRMVITLGYLVIALGGTYAFYKANGGESGERILERCTSLGLVVMIRLMPALFLLMICLMAYIGATEGIGENFMAITGPGEAFVTLGWNILIWYKMVGHVRDVSKAKSIWSPTVQRP